MLSRTFLLTVSAVVLAACSTAPEPRAEETDRAPSMTPLEALDAAAPYLPADSIGVMIASGPDNWESLESLLLSVDDDVLSPGSPGTAQGLRDDLNDFLASRLGFDAMDLHTVVGGGNSLLEATVLAFGDIEFSGDFDTIDTPAGTVYELPLNDVTQLNQPDMDLDGFFGDGESFLFSAEQMEEFRSHPLFDPHIYILPLESPHRGVALSLTLDAFGEDRGLSERANERLRRLLAEVEDRSPSTLFAVFGEDLPPVDTIELPTPNGLLLSLGTSLTVTFSGDAEVLDAIDEALAGFFADTRIQGKHLLEGFSAQLTPRRAEGLHTYEIEPPDRALLMAVALSYHVFSQQMRHNPNLWSDETELVAVTTQPIPAGSTIDAAIIEESEIHQAEASDFYVPWSDRELYLHTPLLNDVEAGQPLRVSDFIVQDFQELYPDPAPLLAPADVASPPDDAEFTESGLASKVLEVGHSEGHPTENGYAIVIFTGWTTDGRLFTTTLEASNHQFMYPLSGMMPGLLEGLSLMALGEKRRFWIPEDLASCEVMVNWPAEMLVIDVELLEFGSYEE